MLCKILHAEYMANKSPLITGQNETNPGMKRAEHLFRAKDGNLHEHICKKSCVYVLIRAHAVYE